MTRRNFYLGAALCLTAGCRPGKVLPSGTFVPATRAELAAAAAATMPRGYELIRIRWRTDDGTLNVSGTGAIRVAPDSLRLDMVVRLGVGRVTLILRGDEVEAEPAMMVQQMLPDRFSLWAALGVIRLAPDSLVVEKLESGARTVWRVRDAQGRENTFVLEGGILLSAVRAENGQERARLELVRGTDGRVASARVTDVRRGARFEVDVTSRQASEAFPRETWHLRP